MSHRISRTLAAIGAAGVLALVAVGASGIAAAAPKGTHFKASGPDFTSVDERDELRTPLDFEREAADNPLGPTALSLFSMCRGIPNNPVPGHVYAPIVPNEADAIVGDTQFFFADGTHCYNPQNESNIVVNPSNPLNVVTSANEYRIDGNAVYYSFDGGATWKNVVLPGWTSSTGGKGVFGQISSFGDPVLAFNSDGSRLYYAGIGGGGVGGGNSGRSGVAVAVSTDGGAHWSAPRMVSFTSSNNTFNDKEWLAVAPDGTVYLTWTRFSFNPSKGYRESPIVVSKSTDGGNTWSDWVNVSDPAHPFDQGSNPAVGPDGTLYVAYEGSAGPGFSQDALIVARSTDGGATFTNTEVTRVFDDLDCYPIQLPGGQGRQTLSYEQFRINSFPNIALDRSVGTTGKLAITWADNRNDPSCGHGGTHYTGTGTTNQVFLVTSTDGTNWSAPQQITSDPFDKVYPSIAASGGKVLIGYYTRSYSPVPTLADLNCARMARDSSTGQAVPFPAPSTLQPVCLDYASRTSVNGYAAETRLTAQSSNPYTLFAGAFIGDYTGMAIAPSGGIAVWSDFRGNPALSHPPNQDTVVHYGF